MPRWRGVRRHCAAAGLAFNDCCWACDSAFAEIAVGKVPCNKDRVGTRFARGEMPSSRMDAPLRPALSMVLEPSLVVKGAGGHFAPEGGERIEFPARAAQPHGLDAWFCADRGETRAAKGFGIRRFAIEEECAFAGDGRVGTGGLVGLGSRVRGGRDDRRIRSPPAVMKCCAGCIRGWRRECRSFCRREE